MKNLKIIQTVAKVGRILSRIVYICCIIGTVGCFLAFLTMITMRNNPALIDFFAENAEQNLPSVISGAIVGMIICGSQIYVAYKSEKYFVHELEVGEPFTHELSKEMRVLALITLIVTLCSNFVCEVGIAIAQLVNPEIADISLQSSSIDYGLALLLLSVLCDYGAEIKDGTTNNTNDENVVYTEKVEANKKNKSTVDEEAVTEND